MTTKGYSGKPSIDRLKDGADKIGRLYASEGISKRVELGIKQWDEIEKDWRGGWKDVLDCPLDPERCGDVPKCQFCKGTAVEVTAVTLVLPPAPVFEPVDSQEKPSLEEITTKLKEEAMILAGTWGMIDDSDDEELTEMLSDGIDEVDNLMIKFFLAGGEGCPLGGCSPEAAVRCKVCAGETS